jgi:hypothetical protein
MIHKVILRYRKPYPLNFGRPQKQSTYRTDAGIGDARAFAAQWAACAHVAGVTIRQGRALLETIKPPTHD